MSETVDTIEYKGYKIKIYLDEDGCNPRDWDNLGKMVCFHRRYQLRDKHDLSVESLKELVSRKDVLSLPLYLLDHSALWMRTGDFSDVDPGEWDSGMVGYIYVDYPTIRKEYSVKRISKKLRAKVEAVLVQEVNTYSDYLSGQVYGYVVENSRWENIDSCWGFYGRDGIEEIKRQTQEFIDQDIQEEAQQNAEDHAVEVGPIAELVEV